MWRVCVCVCVCVYTHTREYYSAMKQNEILSFEATWMDTECIMLSEISIVSRERQILHIIPYI